MLLAIALVLGLLALGGAHVLHRRSAVAPARLELPQAAVHNPPLVPHPNEAGLASLVSHLPGMAYRCRLDGTLELVSPGAVELTGKSVETLTDGHHNLLDQVHTGDRPTVLQELDAARVEKRPFQLVYRLLASDGSERWVWDKGVFVRDADERPLRFEGYVADITSRKLAADRALFDALHDPLTGLANRALFGERLDTALKRLKRRPDLGFAVLSIDLDRFPAVQGSLGREAGEQALRATAERLVSALRQEDTVARLAHHQFAVLLEDVPSDDDAVQVARRVAAAIEAPLLLAGEEVTLTASVGIVSRLAGYGTADEALRDAEIAAHRAKALGGGRHQAYDPDFHQRAVAKLRLETDLRRALRQQDFHLLYQPIVSLVDGSIHGFEALLRWRHAERGLLAPAEFLGTAVESGLIVPISWWAIREACSQVRRWQDLGLGRHGELYVAVNLTSEQLLLPDLTARIAGILAETLLPPSGLRIEITESVMMAQADLAAASLQRLRDLGIRIALDDFGTGYSSLASLRQLPIASLKVDRSFIQGLDSRTTSREIIRAIVAMAQSLDLEVVAEGIERPHQVARLLDLRCNVGQGFLFGVPMESDDATILLSTAQHAPKAVANELLFA